MIKYIQKKYINHRYGVLELERLQQLQQLQQLEQLERLERLQITNLSYNELKIIPNSVVYCDPPYNGKARYQSNDFNHMEFYDWCRNNPNPVFISEYEMPDDFKKIGSFKHRSTLSGKVNNAVFEKLYWNGKYIIK